MIEATIIHVNVEVLSLLEGAVIPLVVSLLTKSKASPTVKAIANAALSALAGAATTALGVSGVIDWQTYALDIMSAFLASVTAYHGLWSPTTATTRLDALTPQFGFGTQPGESHFVGQHNHAGPSELDTDPVLSVVKPDETSERMFARSAGDGETANFNRWMTAMKDPDPVESVRIIPAESEEVKEFFEAPLERLVEADGVVVRSPQPQENKVPNPNFQPTNLLGRIYVPDERDRAYLMARRVPSPAPVGARLWPANTLYDQGQTPMCTGFSSSGALSSYLWAERQVTVDFNAAGLYAWANTHDGIVGPHQGSTVRAAFQGLITQGDQVLSSSTSAIAKAAFEKIQNFLWADVTLPDADIETIITWILTVSPVVIGSNWYNDMFTPDANGYVHPTGGVAGGHAYMLRGVNAINPPNNVFVIRNSWGSWGVTVNGGASGNWAVTPQGSGDALITQADLVSLLKAQGECGALVDSLAPFPAPTPPAPGPIPSPSPAPTPTPVPVAGVVVTPAMTAAVSAAMAAAQQKVLAILGGVSG